MPGEVINAYKILVGKTSMEEAICEI